MLQGFFRTFCLGGGWWGGGWESNIQVMNDKILRVFLLGKSEVNSLLSFGSYVEKF